jgi:hypothetical protein
MAGDMRGVVPPAPGPTAPEWAALGVPDWLSGGDEPAVSGAAAASPDTLDDWLAAVLPVPQRAGSATSAPPAQQAAPRAWSCVVAEHGNGCIR